MNEIKCPECGKVFQIDETSYDSIVKQIRDHEFEKEIEIREKSFQSDKESAVKLAEANTKEKLNEEISKLKLEISSLQNELNFYKEKNEELNQEIDNIKSSLIDNSILNNEINNLKQEIYIKDNQIQIKEEEMKTYIHDILRKQDRAINEEEGNLL